MLRFALVNISVIFTIWLFCYTYIPNAMYIFYIYMRVRACERGHLNGLMVCVDSCPLCTRFINYLFTFSTTTVESARHLKCLILCKYTVYVWIRTFWCIICLYNIVAHRQINLRLESDLKVVIQVIGILPTIGLLLKYARVHKDFWICALCASIAAT